MGHHSVIDESVVVLRRGPKHPVLVILVFDAVFKAQRKVHLRVVTKRNVLDRVEEVRALRWVGEKTPILLGRKRIQWRTCWIWRRTRWLWIGRLRPCWRRRERNDKSDRHKIPTACT